MVVFYILKIDMGLVSAERGILVTMRRSSKKSIFPQFLCDILKFGSWWCDNLVP